ncbi:hypothetical protein CXF86_10895 [Shewanella sp. GutCb]|uniref:hypothetical protein n=1 Tax=Shewanella sp. GutCb TaxID=2058315 RepID=UPI000C7C7391|nr:hypothetical protein [Shewanella sp. GutCb]PKG74791.1 hypothetical protein CXF86_10895 [Shewanella sp. GutCb]
MILDFFTSKWTWRVFCSAALITGVYRIYLTEMGPAAIEAIADKQAIDSFAKCIIAYTTPRYMKSCDAFYLEYLPRKTGPKYNRKIIEIPKLSSKMIISTYGDITSLRQESGLEPYPKLEILSHGKLVDKNT